MDSPLKPSDAGCLPILHTRSQGCRPRRPDRTRLALLPPCKHAEGGLPAGHGGRGFAAAAPPPLLGLLPGYVPGFVLGFTTLGRSAGEAAAGAVAVTAAVCANGTGMDAGPAATAPGGSSDGGDCRYALNAAAVAISAIAMYGAISAPAAACTCARPAGGSEPGPGRGLG